MPLNTFWRKSTRASLSVKIAACNFRGAVMSIISNKKAFHDYFIEEQLEAGLVLEGWEVKAIRAGRVQIKES